MTRRIPKHVFPGLTQTRRQPFPSAIRKAGYFFNRLVGRESETRITLIHSLTAVSYIGRSGREPVVDLWNRTAIHLCSREKRAMKFKRAILR